MIGRDLLLRGRGADIGVRAPGWLIRATGAVLAYAGVWLCDALGAWNIVPVPLWVAHVGALLLGAVLAPSALGSLLWLGTGVLTAILMLVTYTPVVRPLVAPFVRADAAAAGPVDAVVVLSGGVTDDGRVTGQAVDRLLSGIALAKSRHIGDLALSVVVQEHRAGSPNTEADQRGLVAMAAPELSLHLVRNVFSTRDEALAFAALARTRGWQRVALVTSPMHTRRACGAFESAGLAVECRPADGRDYSVRIMDSGENRRLAFQDVVYEVAATALYRAKGWLR